MRAVLARRMSGPRRGALQRCSRPLEHEATPSHRQVASGRCSRSRCSCFSRGGTTEPRLRALPLRPRPQRRPGVGLLDDPSAPQLARLLPGADPPPRPPFDESPAHPPRARRRRRHAAPHAGGAPTLTPGRLDARPSTAHEVVGTITSILTGAPGPVARRRHVGNIDHRDGPPGLGEVRPLTGALGAEVLGVDLTHLDEDAVGRASLHATWLEHLVLFFPEQSLMPTSTWPSPSVSARSRSTPSSRSLRRPPRDRRARPSGAVPTSSTPTSPSGRRRPSSILQW